MGNQSSTTAKATPTADAASTSAACPVLTDAAVYSVYNELAKPTVESGGEVLNERNALPVGLRNRPMPGQEKPLSTDRVSSNIPKGGSEATWTYPSPQMFFNALNRKGKGEDVVEDDMDAVVYAHNTLNEITWRRVLQWEKLHCESCPDPKLLKFCGRPDTPSVRARFYSFFGDGPFDRHDWTVDRCGIPVRYIIDFYFNDAQAGTPQAFALDVRPALDSWTALHDRVKMGTYRVCLKLGLPCPITGHTSQELKE